MNTDERIDNLDAVRAAVLVLCEPERAATRGAETRDVVAGWMSAHGYACTDTSVHACEPEELRKALAAAREGAEVIVVCGATGLGPRDIAPQVLEELCDYCIPGIGEILRAESLKYSRNSYLSRCGGYAWRSGLVLSIPGNPQAAVEQLEILKELLPGAINALRGHCKSRGRADDTLK